MRLDQQSHEMSRSCVFHKIEMWPNLQVGRQAGKTKGGWFAVLWMAAAVAAAAACPSQAKNVRASVNLQRKIDSFRFALYGEMCPKWKRYEAGPNVNTNYHTTQETTFWEKRDVQNDSFTVSSARSSIVPVVSMVCGLWHWHLNSLSWKASWMPQWNSKKKMLMASQIHDSYGKMIQTTHACKSVIPDCELWMNFGTWLENKEIQKKLSHKPSCQDFMSK